MVPEEEARSTVAGTSSLIADSARTGGAISSGDNREGKKEGERGTGWERGLGLGRGEARALLRTSSRSMEVLLTSGVVLHSA